jgi:arabinogalactan oligomer/maltooligosaccharide transport system permease protein
MKRNYDAIPISLEEAAEVEGASAARSFSRIVLPLASPALAITFLFSLLVAWNEYLIGGILLGERGTFAVPRRLDFAPQIMTLPAASLLVSLPAVLLFLVLSRLLVSMSSSRAVEE